MKCDGQVSAAQRGEELNDMFDTRVSEPPVCCLCEVSGTMIIGKGVWVMFDASNAGVTVNV